MKPIRRHSNDLAQPKFCFTLADQRVLRETSPTKNPSIQVFTEHIEDEDEENTNKIPQVKTCPECESYNLKYFNKLDKYYCFSCSYQEEGQTPTKKNNSKQMDIPFGQRGPYAGYDEEDPTTSFLASINVNQDIDEEESNPDIQLISSKENGRIKHYKVKGLPLEAMSAMLEAEDRE